VVGVGLQSGRFVLVNLKLDKVIASFTHTAAITSIAFRNGTNAAPRSPPPRRAVDSASPLYCATDGGAATVATGGSDGAIAVWDLDRLALQTILRNAHSGAGTGVTALGFLTGQPVLVSSGADNALRMWIFDQSDGSARLLRSRSGHSGPPNRIRFYGEDGTHAVLGWPLEPTTSPLIVFLRPLPLLHRSECVEFGF
jgi:U3 small nucleolar RNA-associated protein 21